MDVRDPARLKEYLSGVPKAPGVYIMRDAQGVVLYVGKAIDLRNRLRSYFTSSGDDRPFVSRLPQELADLEVVVTSSEREALILENNLITELSPKYNVNLKDDSSYALIRIDMTHEFPRLEKVRGLPREDGALYFGPYDSARALRSLMSFIQRHFQLRTCTDRTLTSRRRACLYAHMGRCDAPCVGGISSQEYARKVEEAVRFLRGEHGTLREEVTARMEEASEALEFEKAARYRDLLFALDKMAEPQGAVTDDFTPRDVIGVARSGWFVAFAQVVVRDGAVRMVRQHITEAPGIDDTELLASYIYQYYRKSGEFPERVVVPFLPEGRDVLEKSLSSMAGRRVLIRKGSKRDEIMAMAMRTAHSKSQLESEERPIEALEALAKRLKLRALPHRLECYDISHFQGEKAVGSMVVFTDGQPDRDRYRLFNLRSALGGDDYAALREVLMRRFARLGEMGWDEPDLIVIDGGRGQLSAAVMAARDAGVSIPMIGIAKQRTKGTSPPDRIFVPGVKDPLDLRPGSRELVILARLRDEAHRFAITAHRRRRSSSRLSTRLTAIPGVGTKMAARLLRRFGSIKKLKEATLDDLMEVEGVGPSLARRILAGLAGDSKTFD